jgi:hypothetical protein
MLLPRQQLLQQQQPPPPLLLPKPSQQLTEVSVQLRNEASMMMGTPRLRNPLWTLWTVPLLVELVHEWEQEQKQVREQVQE